MAGSISTFTVVLPAAAGTSTPLAYQRMLSTDRCFPVSFALKVQDSPSFTLPSLLIWMEAAANTAVTSRFCLKPVSVRVILVTPSLHFTNT